MNINIKHDINNVRYRRFINIKIKHEWTLILTVYIIIFDETSAICKNINASLMAVKYLIFPDRRIAMSCYPHAGILIRMDFVLNKLAHAMLVDIHASSLSMMNLAPHNSWIGSCFYFETRDAIIVNVVFLEIALQQ